MWFSYNLVFLKYFIVSLHDSLYQRIKQKNNDDQKTVCPGSSVRAGRTRPASGSSTTSTRTASSGTTWSAGTPSPSSARTARSCLTSSSGPRRGSETQCQHALIFIFDVSFDEHRSTVQKSTVQRNGQVSTVQNCSVV